MLVYVDMVGQCLLNQTISLDLKMWHTVGKQAHTQQLGEAIKAIQAWIEIIEGQENLKKVPSWAALATAIVPEAPGENPEAFASAFLELLRRHHRRLHRQKSRGPARPSIHGHKWALLINLCSMTTSPIILLYLTIYWILLCGSHMLRELVLRVNRRVTHVVGIRGNELRVAVRTCKSPAV